MALRFEDGALFEWILPTLNDQRRDQFYYEPLRQIFATMWIRLVDM